MEDIPSLDERVQAQYKMMAKDANIVDQKVNARPKVEQENKQYSRTASGVIAVTEGPLDKRRTQFLHPGDPGYKEANSRFQ